MKIGLIGFGKTGKSVASVLLQEPTVELVWVLRKKLLLEQRSVSDFLGVPTNDKALIYAAEHTHWKDLLAEHPVDVIIDFSASATIFEYGQYIAEHKITLISAVSHYAPKALDYLTTLSRFTKVFWSPNITLGVNYLLFAAKFLQKLAPWVDIEIVEEHFKQKDGISGTAVKIAEALAISKEEVNSIRAGGIVGKHEIIFGFPFQTVRLIHESISREAFGNGVLFVAKNLEDKPIGLYNFEDILRPFFMIHEKNEAQKQAMLHPLKAN